MCKQGDFNLHKFTSNRKEVENEEMIVAVNAIHAIAQRSLKKIQDLYWV